MARLPRVVIAGVAHHVTQRGNGRQDVFLQPPDRLVYLDLLQHNSALYGLAVLGYCLMSNHVHLIVVPETVDSMALALKHTHGRYAGYWNARRCSSGHLWQGRFYSCPLDESHLWAALRYVELNPVRAHMVGSAEDYIWSSAVAHCDASFGKSWLEMERWRKRWSAEEWKRHLNGEETPCSLQDLRRCTHSGRPLGSPEFVAVLEQSTSRSLAPRSAGRRKAVRDNSARLDFASVA